MARAVRPRAQGCLVAGPTGDVGRVAMEPGMIPNTSTSASVAHPLQPVEQVQGSLRLIWELEQALIAITGTAGVTLQPAAGAHGELAGILMIRKALEARGDARDSVLVPDSAHGTNPATAAFAGYNAIEVPSGPDGTVDMEALDRLMTDRVAGVMLTVPNTLGVFEHRIVEISKLVHDRGGLIYMDGANLNAFAGRALPGLMGADAMHINLHKTFSTPHGGGGPGAGPVVVSEALLPHLPVPRVIKDGDRFTLLEDDDASIGAMLSIAREATENPELVRSAPHDTPVSRVDEVRAARKLKVRWTAEESS